MTKEKFYSFLIGTALAYKLAEILDCNPESIDHETLRSQSRLCHKYKKTICKDYWSLDGLEIVAGYRDNLNVYIVAKDKFTPVIHALEEKRIEFQTNNKSKIASCIEQ